MFNRTAAFDAILTRLAAQKTANEGVTDESPQQEPDSMSNRGSTKAHFLPSRTSETICDSTSQSSLDGILRGTLPVARLFENAQTAVQSWIPAFEFKDLLPISFEAAKASLVIGNMSTPYFLWGQFRTGDGMLLITQVLSSLNSIILAAH